MGGGSAVSVGTTYSRTLAQTFSKRPNGLLSTRLISFVAVAGQRRGEKTTPGLWACADKYDATVRFVERTKGEAGR